MCVLRCEYWVLGFMMHFNFRIFNFEFMNRCRVLFALCLLLGCGRLQAQVVYQTEWKSDADIQVYVTEWKSDADLVVYKTTWKSDADKNEGIWYFTEWKSDAKKKLYFTTWKSDASLIVYYTEYKSDAGWKNKDKEHLLQ
jgi:hypothetical protein